jgi:hypothetical protein
MCHSMNDYINSDIGMQNKEKGKTGWNSVYHKNWGPPTHEC